MKTDSVHSLSRQLAARLAVFTIVKLAERYCNVKEVDDILSDHDTNWTAVIQVLHALMEVDAIQEESAVPSITGAIVGSHGRKGWYTSMLASLTGETDRAVAEIYRQLWSDFGSH